MATLADLIMRLERRVIVLETIHGVEVKKENLMHPKSLAQAQDMISQIKADIEAGKIKEMT